MLVAIETYLPYLLGQSNQEILDFSSTAYAIDIGVMILIMAGLYHKVVSHGTIGDRDGSEVSHRTRYSIVGLIFRVSALPFFWQPSFVFGINLRFVVWMSSIVPGTVSRSINRRRRAGPHGIGGRRHSAGIVSLSRRSEQSVRRTEGDRMTTYEDGLKELDHFMEKNGFGMGKTEDDRFQAVLDHSLKYVEQGKDLEESYARLLTVALFAVNTLDNMISKCKNEGAVEEYQNYRNLVHSFEYHADDVMRPYERLRDIFEKLLFASTYFGFCDYLVDAGPVKPSQT